MSAPFLPRTNAISPLQTVSKENKLWEGKSTLALLIKTVACDRDDQTGNPVTSKGGRLGKEI
jgi:hypothetical protein